MSDYLSANLEILSECQPGLAALLRDVDHSRINVFPSFKRLPTARYTRSDGTIIALHSRYDPLNEAREAVRDVDLACPDYFILLGFGLGYVLDALLEQTGESRRHFFIVESDPGILTAAFTVRDFRRTFARHHIHFAHPAEGPPLADQWRSFFDPVTAKRSVYVTLPPSLALNPSLFKSAVERIQSQTFQTFTDINTSVVKSQTFLDNFVQNLPAALSSPGVAEFAGRFPNVPAVLVSAGPSLDRNIQELRGQEDRILILAVDTVLKPLLSAGVRPHFVLTGDPTHTNYLHLKGADGEGVFFVAEATAYPGVFVEFSGRIIVCTYENSILGCLSGLPGEKGVLRAWGSVATMGLDFALTLGCNPVIFVGQDLSHSDGRTYCSGVYFEESWFADIQDPCQLDLRLKSIRAGTKTITARNVFGRPVETTDKLSAYWNWISKELSNHPEVQFINATEGGILKENVTVCSLREALYRHSSPRLCAGQRIRQIFNNAPRTTFNTEILERLQHESIGVAESLKSGARLCEKPGLVQASSLHRQLEGIKDSIYANRHMAPLLDSFNQVGNVTFLRNRDRLNRVSARPGFSDELRNVYGAYFSSVAKARTNLDSTLNRLRAALRHSDLSLHL